MFASALKNRRHAREIGRLEKEVPFFRAEAVQIKRTPDGIDRVLMAAVAVWRRVDPTKLVTRDK